MLNQMHNEVTSSIKSKDTYDAEQLQLHKFVKVCMKVDVGSTCFVCAHFDIFLQEAIRLQSTTSAIDRLKSMSSTYPAIDKIKKELAVLDTDNSKALLPQICQCAIW